MLQLHCLQEICTGIRLESVPVQRERKTPIRGIGFHLSSFASSIFRLPLNHQAQGTSTWLIIGSNSHAARANTFCYEYVTPLWLPMPFFHAGTVHLSCWSLLNLPLTHVQYHVCFFFSSFFFSYCRASDAVSSFPCRSAEVGSVNTPNRQRAKGGRRLRRQWLKAFLPLVRILRLPESPSEGTVSRWSLGSSQATTNNERDFIFEQTRFHTDSRVKLDAAYK